MSRELTSGMVAELTASTFRPFFLFEGIFASSTIRLWDGIGDLSWDGQTWLGNGWFKGLSTVQEDNDVKANGIDVILSGVSLSVVSLILTDSRHSCRGKVYLGAFDSDEEIVADPYLLFEGALSAPRIDDSPNSSQAVLSYEDDLIMILRSRELRYNQETQQSLFAGDRGFEYVTGLQKWTGFWGYKEKPKKEKERKKKNKAGRK